MRELILQRIGEIRYRENNFSRGLMKWNKPLYRGQYAEDFVYDNLNDEELLFVFERILRIHYSQS